jgi:hypothetical protein
MTTGGLDRRLSGATATIANSAPRVTSKKGV